MTRENETRMKIAIGVVETSVDDRLEDNGIPVLIKRVRERGQELTLGSSRESR